MQPSKGYGFTLLEVLISLLILSVCLFGFDAMGIYSSQQSHASYYFNIAMIQINNMEERLSALRDSANLAEQIALWNSENKEVLPLGVGTVEGNFPNFIIAIYWGKTMHRCATIRIGESGCIKEIVQLASR